MRLRLPLVYLSIFAVLSPLLNAQETKRKYKNLQVLPQDVSEDVLGEVMLANLRGLGLRRLEGVGCLYCHVGDMEKPRSEWDYVSDAKPEKRKARVMMAMVQSINEQYLTRLDSRIDASYQVSCYTCHRGLTDPRPLFDVLWSEYETNGIDRAVARYRELHSRYLGTTAYDFRPSILLGLATRMSNRGAVDDAVELAKVNAETHEDEPSALRYWIGFRLERTVHLHGVDQALAELEALESELADGVVTYQLLNWLGWRLRRTDRKAEGEAVLRRNFEKFPGEYEPRESVAFVLDDAGDTAAAVRLLEQWLEEHPDHDRARRLVINLGKQIE